MKELTKKTKGAIIGSVAAVAAVALGLGVWQPWKKPAEADPKPPAQEQLPEIPEEKGPTITVNGEEIPCAIYEGDGWSICVPEGWKAEKEGEDLRLVAPGGETGLLLCRAGASEAEKDGVWNSINPDERRFYSGTDREVWTITCSREAYDELMTAVARTFTLGEERIFGEMPLANEPDWQIADGYTLLWLDKDGYVVNEDAERAVQAEMLSWDEEKRSAYTGKYRIDDLQWAGGYCLGRGAYIDVFAAQAWYETAPGWEEKMVPADGQELRDGWINDSCLLNIAIAHDGTSAARVVPLWMNGVVAGVPQFLWDAEDGEETPDEPATETFTYGNLELEVTDVTDVRTQIFTDDGGTRVEQTVFTCLPGATVTVLDADMSQPLVEGVGTAHPNWAVELDGRVDLRDGMEPFGVPDRGCKVYDLESSLYVLLIETTE